MKKSSREKLHKKWLKKNPFLKLKTDKGLL